MQTRVNTHKLQAAGFERHAVCGQVYYTHPGSPETPGQAPILLLHGVGAGVLPYLALIFNYAATGACLNAV